MRTAQDWLDSYGESHQNPTNKLIHWVCVPAIVFTVFGLLMSIPFPFAAKSLFFNWAAVVFIFAMLFYLRLSFSLFIGFAIVGSLMMLGNFFVLQHFSMNGGNLALFSVAVFVVAWIGQFIGHKIEGAKPSFFEDVQYLMIGPMWLLSFIYQKLGIKY